MAIQVYIPMRPSACASLSRITFLRFSFPLKKPPKQCMGGFFVRIVVFPSESARGSGHNNRHAQADEHLDGSNLTGAAR